MPWGAAASVNQLRHATVNPLVHRASVACQRVISGHHRCRAENATDRSAGYHGTDVCINVQQQLLGPHITQPSEAVKDKSNTQTTLIIVVVALLVLMVALISVIFTVRRCNRKNQGEGMVHSLYPHHTPYHIPHILGPCLLNSVQYFQSICLS